MLSHEAKKYLESEIQKLQEKRASLFSPKMNISETYKRISLHSQNLKGDEEKLERMIENFNNKIYEALKSGYEYNEPSCNERLKELSNLLEEIEKQVQLINWE